jgi:hypothetical protein
MEHGLAQFGPGDEVLLILQQSSTFARLPRRLEAILSKINSSASPGGINLIN